LGSTLEIEDKKIVRICDVGGANPLLDEKYIAERSLHYSVLDISAQELRKLPSSYNKKVTTQASNLFEL